MRKVAMPGTMTRSTRVRNSGPTLPFGRDAAAAGGELAGQHVVLLGTDSSPHVTGFPRFTSALRQLLESRDARVSTPLDLPGGTAGPPVRHRVDLVVAVLPGPGAAAAAVEVANRHDAPLLVLAQGETLPPDLAADRAPHPGAGLAARLEAAALARADRWGTFGESARRRLLARGVPAPRLDRFAYWTSTATGAWLAGGGTAQQADARRAAARAQLGWGREFTVVCPVGGTLPPAISSAAEELAHRTARESASTTRVVVLGRGPRVRAAAGNSDHIELAEPGDDDYAAALAAADVVVVSENGRPDGASQGRLAAALAAGRPVVAAVDPEGHLHAELLKSEGAVLTVPPGDPRRLADALDLLRAAGPARAVMAAAARHHARICLSPVAAATALEALAHRAVRTHELGDAPPGPPADGFSWWGR